MPFDLVTLDSEDDSSEIKPKGSLDAFAYLSSAPQEVNILAERCILESCSDHAQCLLLNRCIARES